MFNTIRSRILILIMGLMATTSMTFIFITTKNFQTEITSQYYRLAKETLDSTMLVIDTEYNDLLSYEIDFINNQRFLMECIGTSILSMVDSFHDQQKAGFLSEQLAKEQCLKRLNEYRYQKNKYFFVYDLDLTGLSHPNKNMVGKKWSGFEDLKKKDALSLIRDIIETKEKAFTVFMWPRLEDMKQVKQIGYFLYYPQWKWIIGTARELGDIEKISLAKEKHILFKLNRIIGRASLNEIGGVLIFDSHGKGIIHTSNLKEIDLNHAGIVLNKSIQDHLRKGAGDLGKPVEYLYSSKTQGEMIQVAFVDYFKYMDWYIAAFIDRNKLKRPVLAIAVRQSVILLLVSLAGIAFAVFISKKISHPLALLTKYSRDLPNSDFIFKKDSVLELIKSNNRNDEITQLADAFAFMESELGKNIKSLEQHRKNLEELVNIRTKELTDTNKNLKNEITERKLSVKALQESEILYRLLSEKYLSIFETVPVSIVILDKNGQIEDINRYHINHISRNKVTKEHFLQYNILDYPNVIAAGLRDEYKSMLNGETLNLRSVYHPITSGGRGRFFNIRGVPLFKDNDVIGAVIIHEDITDLKQTEDALIEINKSLDKKVKERTSALKRLNEHIIYEEEKARKLVAADLHDSVAQTLSLSISKIKNMLESDLPINLENIAEIQGHLEQAVKEIRLLIYQLSPPILDDFEIDIALGCLIEEYNDTHKSRIKYINNSTAFLSTCPAVKMTLYRSINELIVNILKHSGSKYAEVEISNNENEILLRVEDNGIGFDLNKLKNKNFNGFGIYNLSEQIENFGGNIKLFSKPGKGTRILLSIPVLSKRDIEHERNKNNFSG